MIVLTHADFGCEHEFPDDWVFGGANGLHPGADARFQPTTYFYYDAQFEEVFMTQMHWCADVAIDYFTTLAEYYGLTPVYIAIKQPGQDKPKLLRVQYDRATDTAYDVEEFVGA